MVVMRTHAQVLSEPESLGFLFCSALFKILVAALPAALAGRTAAVCTAPGPHDAISKMALAVVAASWAVAASGEAPAEWWGPYATIWSDAQCAEGGSAAARTIAECQGNCTGACTAM